ncbi:MAG TPA: hypothetical protein VMU90_05085 [Solirubrobacteraceae bacterium]|nr:hypothetical protein [Solirubrobacteraceae bacterium]
MPKMIQVRNVPDDVHKILKARAAASGMSLSDYIKRDLEESASRPTMEEIDRRIRSRQQSGIETEFIVHTLHELRDG